MQNEIPSEYQGWWRIIETSQWVNDDLDIMGTALISLTGYADRLRMLTLLAYVSCKHKIGRIVHLGRRLGIRSDVRFREGDVGKGWQAQGCYQNQGRGFKWCFCHQLLLT
jgi:hypothetical protein